jgi:hypothetical protein
LRNVDHPKLSLEIALGAGGQWEAQYCHCQKAIHLEASAECRFPVEFHCGSPFFGNFVPVVLTRPQRLGEGVMYKQLRPCHLLKRNFSGNWSRGKRNFLVIRRSAMFADLLFKQREGK